MFVWITNCLAALTVSALLVVVLKWASPVFSLVDHPDRRRKLHEGVVPLCGGIAIFATFSIVMLLHDRATPLPYNFWLGLLITIIVGVIDDRVGLSAVKRLAAQFVVGVCLVYPFTGTVIVTGIALDPVLARWSIPVLSTIAILFVVGLTNAWNMVDGVDGLAGGTAAVALFFIAFIAAVKGVVELVMPMVVLLAAVCGFLVFNMRSPWVDRAKVFLGDAGSTALGAVIAYAVITLSIKANIAFTALLWIVIVPVVDTLSLIVRRLHARRSPLGADRWHLHHLLQDGGLSPAQTTITIIGISAICGCIGCIGILSGASNLDMMAGLLLPLTAHTVFVLFASIRAQPANAPQSNSSPPLAMRVEHMSHASGTPAQSRPGILSDAI